MPSNDRVKEILGELAGYASLCWQPEPTGVFDSTKAIKAVDQALSQLAEVVRGEQKPVTQSYDDFDNGYETGWRSAINHIANLFKPEEG